MSATSIYFNGRLTRIPHSYSEVDASALEAIGLSASGYVACVGTALGGKPYSAVDNDDVAGTLQASTRPGKALEYFQGGDLLKCEDLLFAPTNEESIQGAQKIYWVKVNPSTASTATFNNGDGPAMVATSQDYGYHTTRINMTIDDGTTKGKLVTVVFDDVTETFDDIGGDGMFSLVYVAATPALGYSTITCQIYATKTECLFTRTQAGLDTDITTQIHLGGGYTEDYIELVSSNALDKQTVTIYGIDALGDSVTEEVVLDGLNVVTSAQAYASFHGSRISAAPAGTVTLRNVFVLTVITTHDAAHLTRGLGIGSNLVVGGGVTGGSTVTLVADGGVTPYVTIIGRLGAVVQTESVRLTGVVPVSSTGKWTYIDYLAVGELVVARTMTVSGTAVSAVYAGGYDTLLKQANLYNSLDGFTFAMISGLSGFLMTQMDLHTAVTIKTTPHTFGADLYLMLLAINAGSGLITVARGTPGTGAPTNTTAPVYLSGGNEGSASPGLEGTPTASASDWQSAIDLLKKVYVNTTVVITGDPAVHAMLKSHCAYMCGAGRMERDGVVGLMNAGLTSYPTKAEIKTQIVALNTRHLRCVGQKIERYNSDGEAEVLSPPFHACLVAGGQAGSPVGTSMTKKILNTLAIYGDSSWDAKDDAEEMIEAGLMFAEQVDGIGFRWVRNITSNISSSNIAYTEGSVNEAMNYAVYNYRTQLEDMVGESGFAGTVQAADGKARGILAELMETVLTGWRSLSMTLVSDVLETSVEMSPVIPINFVKNYVHLYIAPISAAA